MPRPFRQAMACLLWGFGKKINHYNGTTLYLNFAAQRAQIKQDLLVPVVVSVPEPAHLQPAPIPSPARLTGYTSHSLPVSTAKLRMHRYTEINSLLSGVYLWLICKCVPLNEFLVGEITFLFCLQQVHPWGLISAKSALGDGEKANWWQAITLINGDPF